MRIIGIDYGDSRIGLAVSDPLGWTAGGLDTIANNGDIDAVLTVIKDICESYDAGEIVVGFPRNMNGTVGPRAEKTEAFIKRLEENTGLNVVRWDERLTTVAAQKAMLDMGLSPSRKKGMVDRIAAIYILQVILIAGGIMMDEERETIVLIDEEGEEEEFVFLDIIEMDENKYVILSLPNRHMPWMKKRIMTRI